MKKFGIVSALTLTGILAVVPITWAMGEFGGERGIDNKLGFLAWKLDLTEDQQIQIGAELEMAEQQMAAEREYMAELRAELRSLQSDFDASRAEELAAGIGDSTAHLVLTLATSKAAIYQLLNEQQRAELEELMALHDEMRKAGHRRHGGALESL